MKLKLSVIILSWNTKQLLIDCINSIYLSTKMQEIEIIVVDNASLDGSQESIKNEFPEVILIENRNNLGFAKANNIGIELSKGRYVCLLNSDIIVGPSAFDNLIEFMDNNPNIGITGPKLLNDDYSLQLSCKQYPSLLNNLVVALGLNSLTDTSKVLCGEHMAFFPHDKIRQVDALVGAFLIIRREALLQVGQFDERFFIYGEEIDLCRRFWNNGWDVVFYPYAQAIHFGGGSSAREPIRFYKELYKSKFKYWRKHRNIVSQVLFIFISILRHIIRLVKIMFSIFRKDTIRIITVNKIKAYTSALFWLLTPIK